MPPQYTHRLTTLAKFWSPAVPYLVVFFACGLINTISNKEDGMINYVIVILTVNSLIVKDTFLIRSPAASTYGYGQRSNLKKMSQ